MHALKGDSFKFKNYKQSNPGSANHNCSRQHYGIFSRENKVSHFMWTVCIFQRK